MKLHNTLTRNVDELQPINPSTVTVYTCGPTVYDYPHIGNWFTFVRYDVLIRTLRSSGLEPNWVMNITDVGHLTSDADEGEDKLEKGAKREGKSAWDVAKFYSDYFIDGLQRLHITYPTQLPKATDHIPEQIDLIKRLEEKGLTYVINDGVYYDTSKFANYGKMARLDLQNLREGARVEANPEKRNPTDFALWKFSPKDHQRDMEWDSPWGKGFPGWHLECSAMAFKYLGETLDIHAGGIDHIPVHHTNEIAQSEGASGKQFANIWLHANFILVDGKKMSKSLNNFYTLEDIEAKGYDLRAFRLLVLESNYRTEANFSWDSIEAAHNRLQRWQQTVSWRWQSLGHEDNSTGVFKKANQDMLAALQNDLNTPEALRIIDAAFDTIDQNGLQNGDLQDFTHLLQNIDLALGIDLFDENISDEQRQLIAQRQTARDSKDWARSDEVRDTLHDQGIGVRDTAFGPIWFRR